jgi:hypothetical protein
MLTALFEMLGALLDGLIPWRRRLPAGPIKSATLPPGVADAIVAALKAGQDPAAALPRGWRGFTAGLIIQDEPQVVARVPVGADLPLAIDRSYVRVDGLGHLPLDEELEPALQRGWVRCWLASRRSTSRYPDGAALVFVAVYDPR